MLIFPVVLGLPLQEIINLHTYFQYEYIHWEHLNLSIKYQVSITQILIVELKENQMIYLFNKICKPYERVHALHV